MSVNSVHGVHSSALKDILYLWFWEVRMESFQKVSEISNIQRTSLVRVILLMRSFLNKSLSEKKVCGICSFKF